MKALSRQRIWQLKQKEKGNCVTCGKKATKGTYCEKHYRKQIIYAKKTHYGKPINNERLRLKIEELDKEIIILKEKRKKLQFYLSL